MTSGERILVESPSFTIDQQKLKMIAKRASVLVEKGNAIHDFVARIEQDESICIKGVGIDFGGNEREIGYQITSGDNNGKDVASEIYAEDIIHEALALLLPSGEEETEIERRIAALKAGQVIVIPFDFVDDR